MTGTGEIEIRTANRDDPDAIVELLRRDSITTVPVEPGLSTAQIEAFNTIAAHPDNDVIVATLGGEVIARLQLTFIPGLTFNGAWRAQVEGVRVRGDLRSQRIGTGLMEWAIRRARERLQDGAADL